MLSGFRYCGGLVSAAATGRRCSMPADIVAGQLVLRQRRCCPASAMETFWIRFDTDVQSASFFFRHAASQRQRLVTPVRFMNTTL